MAEVSATADPLIPANSMLVTMLTWASPPRRWPTRVLAKFTRLMVIPARFITSPVRMKNGMASNGNWWMPANVRWNSIFRKIGFSASRNPTIGANPSAKTIGMPTAMATRKIQKKVIPTPCPLLLVGLRGVMRGRRPGLGRVDDAAYGVDEELECHRGDHETSDRHADVDVEN